jgi:hypothetical protein
MGGLTFDMALSCTIAIQRPKQARREARLIIFNYHCRAFAFPRFKLNFLGRTYLSGSGTAAAMRILRKRELPPSQFTPRKKKRRARHDQQR